jgi:hypothetical protein
MSNSDPRGCAVMACIVGLLVGILWFFFVFLPLDYIVVINDVDQNVWVKWRRGAQILHDRQLAPHQESDRYPSDSKERVEMITTQVYANNQSQWIDLRVYDIPSGVYDATYKVSQLRSTQQATVVNDMDGIDVQVTYLTGNDTLCEVRLTPGKSDSCSFQANQPVEQIFTDFCRLKAQPFQGWDESRRGSVSPLWGCLEPLLFKLFAMLRT